MKKQHAVLTLVDDGQGSFTAQVNYQPSLKGRQLGDDSPAVNAMIKLCLMIARGRDMLGASLQPSPENVTEKQLTKETLGSKIRNFLFS